MCHHVSVCTTHFASHWREGGCLPPCLAGREREREREAGRQAGREGGRQRERVREVGGRRARAFL
jgi:hypothetical protein